jgi:hypothetical protein
MCCRSIAGSNPGEVAELRHERAGVAAAANVVADARRLAAIEDDQIPAAVLDGLRGGRLRFLVPHLPVNHRRVAAFRIAAHVLPDVQHRAARGVDQRAAAAFQLLQHRHRHTERGENDDVVRPEAAGARGLVAEELDAHRAQLLVDVRVVNDLAGQVDRALRKPLARLVRVVDGAIHAVAEAELSREVDGETSRAVGELVGLDAIDESAVIVVGQHAGDGVLQVEAFTENERRHSSNAAGKLATTEDTGDTEENPIRFQV